MDVISLRIKNKHIGISDWKPIADVVIIWKWAPFRQSAHRPLMTRELNCRKTVMPLSKKAFQLSNLAEKIALVFK